MPVQLSGRALQWINCSKVYKQPPCVRVTIPLEFLVSQKEDTLNMEVRGGRVVNALLCSGNHSPLNSQYRRRKTHLQSFISVDVTTVRSCWRGHWFDSNIWFFFNPLIRKQVEKKFDKICIYTLKVSNPNNGFVMFETSEKRRKFETRMACRLYFRRVLW